MKAALLPGERLHLQHGPIDLIIGVDPTSERVVVFDAAKARFSGLLEDLVGELDILRAPLHPNTPPPTGRIARRMHNAALPHCAAGFVTRMAAVAGAVADEVMAAMIAEANPTRAYVNNGGDIAVHLAPGETFDIALAREGGGDLGRVHLRHKDSIGGIATSGAGGRSLSLGIADSVTVLAANAAAADVAATLIANAVNLPDHPAITRERADHLDPDSDLGARAVVVHVGALSKAECSTALEAGRQRAEAMRAAGLIAGAALFLRGERALTGAMNEPIEEMT